MPTFTVAGQSPLLVELVSAALRQLYPDAPVRGAPATESWPGVRVTVAGNGRWLYVAASTGIDDGAIDALADGASAVVHLASTGDEFRLALDAIVRGERGFVPVDLVRLMAGEAMERKEARRERGEVALTQREREILQLVARGYSNSEIAAALTISTNTVRSHLHALSVKLDATSRTKMLANARALAIPEALDLPRSGGRASA